PWTAQEAGKRIEAFLSKSECAAPKELIVGTIAITCQFVREIDVQPDDIEPVLIAWNTDATLYDHSGEFPKGHGYALFAEGGGGGPEVAPAVVTAAFNGQKPQSQLNPSRLREIWGAGTQQVAGGLPQR